MQRPVPWPRGGLVAGERDGVMSAQGSVSLGPLPYKYTRLKQCKAHKEKYHVWAVVR